MKIQDQVAIVTGGASGIGEALGGALAERGAQTIALVDRDERVITVAQQINTLAQRATAVPFIGDVTDDAFRRQVFDDVSARFGLPRLCVPAAGITRDTLAVKLSKETGEPEIYSADTFRQVLEINLTAPTYWALELIARIAHDRRVRGLPRWEPTDAMQGAIVLVGSVSSLGNKGQVSYAASKAGLQGVAATLSSEGIFYGVRCAIIHPGFTDTPMVRALGNDLIQKHVLPNTQLRRLIRPEEIAEAICFLLTNPALSGPLWADAGWHAPA